MFSAIINDIQRSELEALYKNNHNRFLNAAYKTLHDKTDAEDAVQEAFRAIIKAPEHLFEREPEKRIGYMIGVVKHISVDMFNKNNNRSAESLDEDEAYDNAFSFDDEMIGIISEKELMRFIEKLPYLQREVLRSRCFMGNSTAKTAKKLHISQTAVKKRLRLAKEAIREYVKKESETHE